MSFPCIRSIYCINLDTRQDRWTRSQVLFESLGLADRLVRVPGVMHDKPATGCTKAHLSAVKRAERECPADGLVLICEDDLMPVKPLEDVKRELEQALEQRDTWTQLYWAMTPQQLGDGDGLRQILVALGGAGTLMNRQGLAQRREALVTALRTDKPWDMVAASRQATLGTVYGFYPAIFRQAPGRSDIEGRDVDYAYLEVGGQMLPTSQRP